MESLGLGAYWYTSGGSADSKKKAAPIYVSFDAGALITSNSPSGGGDDVELPSNVALAPPQSTTSSSTTIAPRTVTPLTPANLTGVPVAEAAAALGLLPTSTDLTAVSYDTGDTGTSVLWWVGGALLIAAAALLTVPGNRSRRTPH